MEKSIIYNGDCFELIKTLPDNSVDLFITSPPYADIVNYGKSISIQKPEEYCDWLLPIFNEIQRVLKPSGSFILNINDNCKDGYRNTFIYELIYRSQKETKLKFYDTYIWHKMNGIPNGGSKRFRNTTEFIFHFVKDQKNLKFYMDRVLQDTNIETKKRFERNGLFKPHGEVIDGVRIYGERDLIVKDKVRPDNVVRFSTAGASRDNTIKHPAPFHKNLPAYYINLLTDNSDTIVDIFNGIGTTGLAVKEIGGDRKYIGFELNPSYTEFSKERLK
jgi:DNA modification methylase